jgi:hypothetical protein
MESLLLPVILYTKAVMTDFVSDIEPENTVIHRYWTTYELAPCSYGCLYLLQIWNVSIIFLFAVIVAIAILIIMEISKFNSQLLIRSSLKIMKIKRNL